MSDLGALLRKAREQRGYTLDDIQEVTKIRKRYLDAIENGEYKVLPGSFYVRAFVKTYAETVGLDAEEVLRLYQKELPKPVAADTIPDEPLIRKRRRNTQHRDRWGKWTVTLVMWLFPILIVAIVYVYLQQHMNKDPKEVDSGPLTTDTSTPLPPNTDAPSITIPPETPTAPESPSSSPVTLTLKETRKSVQYYDVAPGGTHKLELEVTGECWIGINENNSSGKFLYQKSFKASDTPQTLVFELADMPLFVNVGRADNVSIRVGGIEVEDTNASGSNKFVFTSVTP